MYTRRTRAALYRSIRLTRDAEKVAEGIALSLKQISTSASRADERDGPRTSRTARAKSAVDEVSSFTVRRPAQPSGGVDARSLGAARPTRSTYQYSPSSSRSDARQTQRGRVDGLSSTRRSPRDNFTLRGRGQFRGRGSGSERGRGGRRRGGPEEDMDEEDADDAMAWDPKHFSEEELEYIAGQRLGVPTAYIPTTPLSLEAHALPMVMSSAPQGFKESILDRMRIATRGLSYEHLRHPQEHLDDMRKGKGTVFENEGLRAQAQHWGIRMKTEGLHGGVEGREDILPFLSEQQKEEVAGEIVGGRYEDPGFTELADVLGTVRNTLVRNGSYLPGDVRKLEGRLRKLLPRQLQQSKPVAA